MPRPTYIDPTALVHPDAVIGQGVMIWNWTKVRERASIGDMTIIGQCAYIDLNVRIGSRCKIQNGVSVYNGVTVGDDVFIGPNATLTNDLRPRAHSKDWRIAPTWIENGASIGANATIVCGLRLGAHSMVAAGAVVTRDVPAHALVLGCPAQVVDYVTIQGERVGWRPGTPVPDLARLAGE